MTVTTTASGASAPARRRFGGRLADLGIAIIAIALAVILFVGTLGMNVRGNQVPGPQFFPFLVSGLLLVVGTVLLVSQLRARRAADAQWHAPDVSEDMLRDFGAGTELIDIDAAAAAQAEAARVPEAPAPAAGADASHPFDWRTVGIVVGAVVFFIVALELLGWILSAASLFWLIAYAFGSKRPVWDAGVGLLVASIAQLVFVAGLGLTLPSGFVGVLF